MAKVALNIKVQKIHQVAAKIHKCKEKEIMYINVHIYVWTRYNILNMVRTIFLMLRVFYQVVVTYLFFLRLCNRAARHHDRGVRDVEPGFEKGVEVGYLQQI